eukprot:GFKZ01012210.1.p1 GENE.GFKZ01012210.1~~GFKZ01012210.1.p1  ORF type:complete len:321 (-),score=30.79 GFKZ01012210.1:293-1255(-)
MRPAFAPLPSFRPPTPTPGPYLSPKPFCHPLFSPRPHVPRSSLATPSSHRPSPGPNPKARTEGIRINKCLKAVASRRESDALIAAGRVLLNGHLPPPGARVMPGDEVRLDGRLVDWQRLTIRAAVDTFTYLKMWKPVGVITTTDPLIPNNIIAGIPPHFRDADRVFPVGRLDEQSTGLILLTSDGRLPNVLLGAGKRCVKEYLVTPDMYVKEAHLQRMREGVVVKSVVRRHGGTANRVVEAATLPCGIDRVEGGNQLLFRLEEGRNRQIRKMLGVVGYTARAIHRVAVMDITLRGLKGPGDVRPLDDEEMEVLRGRLAEA